MNKKKLAAVIICVAAAVVMNILVFKYIKVGNINDINTIEVTVESDRADEYQIFYQNSKKFTEEKSSKYQYMKPGKKVGARFTVPMTDKYLRLDLGNTSGSVRIYDMSFSTSYGKLKFDLSVLDNGFIKNGIKSMAYADGYVDIVTEGTDPYIAFEYDVMKFTDKANTRFKNISLIVDIVLCVIIDVLLLLLIKYIGRVAVLPMELYNNRALIASLSKNDFKTKFSGSVFGIIWAFIQPSIMILVYWFVFENGLKAGRVSNHPFILWFMAGLIPWFFFTEAFSGGTNALIEYSYLVKKVVFKISILPIVKVISSLYVHLFFVAVIILLSWSYGYNPDLYSLQLVYYMVCEFLFVLGLSYLTSALVCFFRDLTQIINIILQVGMWMTPIMWDASILSPTLHIIFKLNPMYYIVAGFRDAILDKVWFWDKLAWGAYFWIVIVVIFGVGITVFRRLRVHFADVL